MGLFDELKERARRSLSPTAKEKKTDQRKRISSYKQKAKELRAETGYLKAKKGRDKYLDTGGFGFGGPDMLGGASMGHRKKRGAPPAFDFGI